MCFCCCKPVFLMTRLLNEMNIWDQILSRVETKVNRHSFYTWFKPTSFISADSAAVTIRVPNGLFKDWLTKHYSGVISEALGEVRKGNLAVNFVAESPADGAAMPFTVEEAATFDDAHLADPAPAAALDRPVDGFARDFRRSKAQELEGAGDQRVAPEPDQPEG